MDGSLYTLLGVAPNATAEEIRSAYLSQVARFHPDRHEGNPLAELAAEKLSELNRAYEVLSDPLRRAEYDASLRPATGALRHRPWWTRPWGVLLLALAFLVLLRVPVVRAVLRPGTPGPLVALVLLAVAFAAYAWHRRRRRQPLRQVLHSSGKRPR